MGCISWVLGCYAPACHLVQPTLAWTPFSRTSLGSPDFEGSKGHQMEHYHCLGELYFDSSLNSLTINPPKANPNAANDLH